jgi:spore germination cell wall hydrolase CwlJ-like protein
MNNFILRLLIVSGIVFTSGTVASDTMIYSNNISLPKPSEQELHCLAQNIYFESRSDNMAGQFAVADVVLNRVTDERYPTTICDVVKQGKLSKWHLEQGRQVPVRHKCQFSWYCDGKSDDPADTDSWEQAKLIAYQISMHRQFRGITEGATHYHAYYVDPSWARRFNQIGTIGLHKFYRAD